MYIDKQVAQNQLEYAGVDERTASEMALLISELPYEYDVDIRGIISIAVIQYMGFGANMAIQKLREEHTRRNHPIEEKEPTILQKILAVIKSIFRL